VRERVLVLGLGLDALVVAWVLRQNPGWSVAVLGAGPVGYRDVMPLKVLHTRAFARFLVRLDVDKSSYQPQDGIALRGAISAYPEALCGMPDPWARRVHADYLAKLSRLSIDGIQADFPKALPPRRLRFHPKDLTDALTRDLEHVHDDALAIYPHFVRGSRCLHPYDRIVITTPPWAIERTFFRGPNVVSARRHVFWLASNDRGLRRWDQILAPYTPGRSAVRVTPFDSGYFVEVTGALDRRRARLDVDFFFERAVVERAWTDLSSPPRFLGHFEPMPSLGRVAWLGEWAQPGRFGEPMTLDGTFDGAYRLLRQWAHARGRVKTKVKVPR
jgi:hypothetical protein